MYKFYECNEIETARKVVDESNFYLFYEFYEYWTRGKGRGDYKLLFVLPILRTLDKGEGRGDYEFYKVRRGERRAKEVDELNFY